MINPWTSRYEKKFAYSLYDILKYGLDGRDYTENYPGADNSWYAVRSLFTGYGVESPSTSVIPTKYIDNDSLGLLNMILNRYWDEYVFESEEEMENPLNILSYPNILYKTRRFIQKLWDIIIMTYPKYSTILDSYDSQKTHLLDKLQKTIDGEINNSGYQTHEVSNTTTDTRRDNDTPQDSGSYDDDSHTSFISEGSGSSSGLTTRRDGLKMENDVTESWDTEPIIERLDKIQRLYQKTMQNWLDEFRGLFIEGGNYQ